LRNVRWAGRDSFAAWQFKVTVGGYIYSFIVPKVCGNFSLVSRVAAPVPTAPEPPRPEPPPPPPAPEPPPPPPPPPPAVVAAVVEESEYEPWIASFNLGNYFDASTDVQKFLIVTDPGVERISRNWAFGGQIAYVWRQSNLGAEFLADWAPEFLVPTLLFSDKPTVSAYMFNAIYGVPFGHVGNFRPYVSAGIGAIHMSADLIQIDTNLIETTISASQSRFGGNWGLGGLGYVGRVGVRADIRWFRATRDSALDLNVDNTLLNDTSRLVELSGLKYWRSSLGLAFRW
jgi:opacity protein-like surface antigen